ncbi:phage portal protein [Desulfuribacillus stibiiarsenatis]|uniref:Phage portal protein n=2 Tax=Desulfuribacillus stibiiarsenatis TaxID=1390249 RepID=A0A1E5L803_9FIRM|nr:phage portal protein [Desulfuribacillus stibiiarsenatis]
MEEALQYLIKTNGNVTSQIIKDLIDSHAPERTRMKSLYERYKSSKSGVPIFARMFEDTNKINRKINNDFFGEIVDTKTGYFMGHPVSYMYDTGNEKAKESKEQEIIKLFNTINNIDDQDAETAKMMAICGLGVRMLYVDRDGKERAMNVNPWESIFIYDRSIDEPQYAMRYYPMYIEGKEFTRVEWYDDKVITYYIQLENGEYALDDTEPVNPQPHLFSYIPLIPFINNEELQGDAEKVLELIDAYDRAISDVNSEIEQFRLAYMIFYGIEVDEETVERAKRTGAFGIPDGAENGKAEFLTKSINDSVIENHLNRIEDNILRFAKTVNFADDTFGSASGIALKFKLLALENKCITAERKFTSGLRRQMQILGSAWQTKGIPFDYSKCWFGFKRNLPIDILSEADSTTKLRGHVSEKTRLSLLSFIDDVDWEIKQMQEESEGSINLEDEDINKDDENESDEDI